MVQQSYQPQPYNPSNLYLQGLPYISLSSALMGCLLVRSLKV